MVVFGQTTAQRPKARFGIREAKVEDIINTGDEQAVEEGMDEMVKAHLMPKVMVPYVTRPGETPRKVLIQRKRRLFAQQDLHGLIHQEGVDESRLSTFGLEVFDNTDYESRLHSEWVPKTLGFPVETPAKVAVFSEDGKVSWEPCTVLDYDGQRSAYAVKIEGADIVDSETGDRNPAISWVPRVRLYFAAEDPFVFAKRYADASAGRARAESMLRYSLYIDSMPIEDLPPVSTEQVNRMLDLALNSKKLKDRRMDSGTMIGEVNMEYARTMNKIIFDEAHRRGGTGSTAPLVHLNEIFPTPAPRPAPERAVLTIEDAGYDFPQQFSEFSFHTLLTKGEVISTMGRVHVECAKVLKMCLFTTSHTKSLRLDEFEQGQMQNIDQVGSYVKDSWCTSLKSIIKSSFKDVGKGW